MTSRVAVTKMHGARNDFIVIDERAAALEEPAAFARWACDRHTGIGADGVLLIGPSSRAHATMRVINADGGEAEMCGNGIRCVARFLDEAGEGGALAIETAAGIIETHVLMRDPQYQVRVGMGVPRIDARAVSALGDAVFVDMGNPHVVLFGGSLDPVDLVATGEAFQRDSDFPHGTNVHAVAVENRHTLRVRHYERGVGLTMACGTGVVACAAAGIDRGLVESPVTVHVPGGELRVEWDGVGRSYLIGPAIRVFDAQIEWRAAVHA